MKIISLKKNLILGAFVIGAITTSAHLALGEGLTCDRSQSECIVNGKVEGCCYARSHCQMDQQGKFAGCSSNMTSCDEAGVTNCGMSVNDTPVCCAPPLICAYQTYKDGRTFPNGCADNTSRCGNKILECGNSCCNQTQKCVSNKCVDSGVCKPKETLCIGDNGATCCPEGKVCKSKPKRDGGFDSVCEDEPAPGRCKAPQYCCSVSGDCNASQPITSCCNPGTTCGVDGQTAQCCPPPSYPVATKEGRTVCGLDHMCGANSCPTGFYCENPITGACAPYTKDILNPNPNPSPAPRPTAPINPNPSPAPRPTAPIKNRSMR